MPIIGCLRVNSKLPPAIRVMDCEEVPKDFHARFGAVTKTYTYDLCLAPVLPPLSAGLAWHLPRQLDADSLVKALNILQGEHSFQAFAAKRGNETEDTDYVRVLSQCELVTTEVGYKIIFSGNGFLYKMARLLTGSAVYAAQGRACDWMILKAYWIKHLIFPMVDLHFALLQTGLILDHVNYS